MSFVRAMSDSPGEHAACVSQVRRYAVGEHAEPVVSDASEGGLTRPWTLSSHREHRSGMQMTPEERLGYETTVVAELTGIQRISSGVGFKMSLPFAHLLPLPETQKAGGEAE